MPVDTTGAGSAYRYDLAARHPDGPWTTQRARNLMMEMGERSAEFRFVLCDRAGQFTASFDAVLAGADIQVVPSLPGSCR